MITFAEIQAGLVKADISADQSRAITEALELSQRKTATEVEGDLRQYLEIWFAKLEDKIDAMEERLDARIDALGEKFVTKEDFHKAMGDMRFDLMKWMFICWSSQILAIVGMLLGVLKMWRP